MSKKRVRLKDSEAIALGRKVLSRSKDNRNPKYVLSEEEVNMLDAIRGGFVSLPEIEVKSESRSKSNQYRNKKSTDPDGRKVLMSSWDYKRGRNMNIEEYCERYNLPYKHLTSWKAVTHTGTPYYNVVFKTVSEQIEEDLTEDYIEKCILKHVAPVMPSEVIVKPSTGYDDGNIDRLIYSDVHIGLDPNGDRKIALYPRNWHKEDIFAAQDEMISMVRRRQTGATLVIDELGDFMDGWDGQTVRKGHHLPQCMTNEEAFDVGLEFKIRLVQKLAPFYDQIICNNVCEDNHAGAFGYVVNKAFKQFIELQFPNKVNVWNRREFITHYHIANHTFVLCHGKDAAHLKFGFKPQLDPKQSEKIDQYLKHHELYKSGNKIEFSKGDSHQLLFDMCTSDDFEYMNYPAFSPSSDWVQVNFKKGRQGFVIQHLDAKSKDKFIDPIFI